MKYSDQLVAIAVLAAAASGDFVTAALVPLALDLGRLFEERTAMGTQSAIRNIRALQAERATRIVAQKEEVVAVEDLRVGDVLLIRAGERIAADGVVLSGASSVDQSAMTGEAKPAKVGPGSQVFAGSININGLLRIEISRLGDQSSLGRIISLLGDAELSKTPIIRQLEKWLAMYMPVALALAATVLFFTEDLSRAIAVLIVAFPTALAVSGSSTMVAAFSKASRFSVLIKDASFFQLLHHADTVVFDKTGTLTQADQRIAGLDLLQGTEEELLAAAATCAQASLHPISQAITNLARERAVLVEVVTEATEHSGNGVEACLDGVRYFLGRLSWLEEQGVDTSAATEKGTGAWIAREGVLLGFAAIEDPLRSESPAVIEHMRRQGFVDVILLTGDQQAEAKRVAKALSIEVVYAQKLPEDKLDIVRGLREEGRSVLMIGDGINDALALQEADVGVAIGASLNRAAAGGADAALLSSELLQIPRLLGLADDVQKTILQNIVISVLFALLMLVVASTGVITPLMAAILHNLGAVLVIGNASRILVD